MKEKKVTINVGECKIHLVLGKTLIEWQQTYDVDSLWDFPFEELIDGTIEPDQEMWYWYIDGRCYETTNRILHKKNVYDMKEHQFNKRGTKQIINSGWKLFDQQTNLITSGNCYCNTQYSSYIRPWREKECNGRINPEGHLMKYDMDPFDRHAIPQRIREILVDKERKDSVILYMFFVTNKEKHIQPFGWVVTSRDKKLIAKQIVRRPGQQHLKRIKALDEAIQYITE